jgi:hypothetical protein
MGQMDPKTHRQTNRQIEMGKKTERHNGKQKDRREGAWADKSTDRKI